ncbi:DUF4476 domain-containing protein [Sporocytophaga myxococcoides]|uniref:DUF4476 domain-containing protein n=1 Tax=Sporocytophaga myxococcoides TaxID=153721 RepID=UPI000426D584|nr:DUF4476 domain-containing protein [Sporocytophaga myxococcoides]
MKNISLSLFLILISFSGKSMNAPSELYFRLYNGGLFTISIDDQEFKSPCNNFRLSSIFPGKHLFQINKLPPVTDLNTPLSPNALIEVPSSSVVYLVLDPNNQIRITNIVPLNSISGLKNNYCSESHLYSSYSSDISYCSEKFDYLPIEQKEFENIKNDIKEINSDFNRLIAIKDFIYHNKLSTPQVGELMLLFSFEKERLDLAKYAFSFVSDPRKYNQISQYFIFNGTTQQLWFDLSNSYKD